MTRAADIDAWLPQTQCQRCGYPRCRAYAEAIARGETTIDRCPPGGETTRTGLARLLGQSVPPPDPACGEFNGRTSAVIREDECIGCTLCIQACPVDAIVGSSGWMHTVIADECTGCELCVPVCPVDCIDLPAATVSTPSATCRWPDHPPAAVERARERTAARLSRLALRRSRRATRGTRSLAHLRDRSTVRAELDAALARARARVRRNTDPGS